MTVKPPTHIVQLANGTAIPCLFVLHRERFARLADLIGVNPCDPILTDDSPEKKGGGTEQEHLSGQLHIQHMKC